MSINIIKSHKIEVPKQSNKQKNIRNYMKTSQVFRSKSLDGFMKLLQYTCYQKSEQNIDTQQVISTARQLNTQRTLMEFGFINGRSSPIKKNRQHQRSRQKNYKFPELEYKIRRLSCGCSECGMVGRKIRKFHDILISKVNEEEEEHQQTFIRNGQKLRGIFNQVAKSAKVCLSLRTLQSEKEREEKMEFSPEPKSSVLEIQCKQVSRKIISQNSMNQLPLIRKPQMKDYIRKINNLNNLIEQTQLIICSSSTLIRNSAPNLDAFEKRQKESPMSKREQSMHNSRYKQNIYLIKSPLNGLTLQKFRDNDIEQPSDPQEKSGFVSKFSQSFRFLKPQNVVTKVQDVQQAAMNWKNFAIFFGLGLCFMFIAFTFLPLIMVFPAKFGGLFSLGSLSLWISLFIIKGGTNFMKMFCNKEKFIYTNIYVIMLMATVYFSLIHKNYILVLMFSIAQMISLGWLFASSFPAGITGMKFITKQILALIKQIMSFCFKSSQSNSFLPI
ncbi:unnamed protein product [Paramecium pentaurelia]|uniref:Vesicle transport protein n=1 Tax=Paramecium pentaurelia TaxID=43138 RepID=A0A8S1VZG2_9CILI|nr:unnamed protein product [Paramecium pentaurelia]